MILELWKHDYYIPIERYGVKLTNYVKCQPVVYQK